MLCYELDDYTKYIYPLKLHEYFAAGRPIVSSPIPIVQEFAQLIKQARTSEEWTQAITDSLGRAAYSAAEREESRRVAQRHDWHILVRRIARAICKQLGSAYVERFDQITLATQSEVKSL
jgi:hypothetical protein